jgi:hypothetical protein
VIIVFQSFGESGEMVHYFSHDSRMFDEVVSKALLDEIAEFPKTLFKLAVLNFLHRFGELINRLLDIRFMRCLFGMFA